MKPISFENLRRFVGGKRKKKEKDSGFKRSESFKRISIRKSYLDRGKKKHLPKLEVATQTVPEEELTKIFETSCKVDSAVQVDRDESIQNYMELPRRKGCNKNMSKSKEDSPLVSFGGKGSERTVIYVPASDDSLPSPIIRELPSSPSFRRKSSHAGCLERKESNDSAVEMFPWGDSMNVKKSPILREKNKVQRLPSLMPPDSGNEEMCSLSISLGRIWMDAPQVMAPRSLEIPRNQNNVNQSAHHSLDSALRDMKEETTRYQKRQVLPVSRTSSSNSNHTNSTGLLSSRDSGLSFSVPATRFQSPFRMTSGFFSKQPKPKLSVSRDGYFKRTSGVLIDNKRSSLKRRSSRKKRGKKNRNNKSDIYQVVVGRRPRQLAFLKLDPMIFVPPEKRNPSVRRKKSFRTEMCEIRNLNPNESIYLPLDSTDDDLYESLPDDLDLDLWEDDVSLRLNEDTELLLNSDDGDSSDYCVEKRKVRRTSSGAKTRSVKRKKSVGISRKRNATFVVRPTIVRAPSTLRRPTRKNDVERGDGYPVQQPFEIQMMLQYAAGHKSRDLSGHSAVDRRKKSERSAKFNARLYAGGGVAHLSCEPHLIINGLFCRVRCLCSHGSTHRPLLCVV
ncbi:hypothetical protein HHI36_020908 [Cryptolaemus montrouzieri]|uniref:Uncharacterized protein n=1 Tax=Cryptolaemus montrouzieri TaxID=559131 RepID=A0ABD2NCH5_9CUCU